MNSSTAYELAAVKSEDENGVEDSMKKADGVMGTAYTQDLHNQSFSTAAVLDMPEEGHDSSESPNEEESACCSAMSQWYKAYSTQVKYVLGIVLLLLWIAYFIWAMVYNFKGGFDPDNESAIRLLAINVIAVFCVCYWAIKKYYGQQIWKDCLRPCTTSISIFVDKHWLILRWVFAGILLLVLALILAFDVGMKEPRNLISLIGMAVYIALFYVFSAHPSKVQWRPVIFGLVLQFIFAYLILRTCPGYLTFKWLGDRVQEFLEHTDAGSEFLFGAKYTDHFFAFKVLPIVVFFSTIISMLYYLGVMQIVIQKVAWVMQVTMGTTAAESLNAAGNIFVGQTEAPLMIKPLLHDMTKSELHAVMTGGFATIAGSVLATYILFGVPASHLLSASVMSAPAALAMSKLFYPETEKSKTTAKDVQKMGAAEERNLIEAASAGASASIKLVANIAANLIAFLALLEFINQTLIWLGAQVGLKPPGYPDFTFQFICSYVLYPFAWIMGTPPIDCKQVATLIGIKTFTNEFIAYEQLGLLRKNRILIESWADPALNHSVDFDSIRNCYSPINGTYTGECLPIITERGETISIYALCGFANLGSIGIMLGALGAMAPERKRDMSSTVVRAMISGNVACFLTACIAGLLSVPGALNTDTCGSL